MYNKRDPSAHLLQLGKDLSIPFKVLPENIIMSNLTAARKELRKAKKNAAEICDEYLKEMACLQITSHNTDIATIIKSIHHREEVKSSFRLMKPIAKGEIGGTVSYIKDPIPIDSPSVYPETLSFLGYEHAYKDIYNDDEVMSKLLFWNKLHLN
eukprot:6917731-Ditylum_brightwellii.AAC.2